MFPRFLAVTVIPLAGPLLAQSSATYPKVMACRAGTRKNRSSYSLPIWSCSVWGLPCPLHYCRGGALLPHLFTLTLALPLRRYVFCGTSRQPTLRSASRTLSGTLLCGVRTFLPPFLTKRERPSGPAAYAVIICEALRVILWVVHSCRNVLKQRPLGSQTSRNKTL